MNVIKRFVNFWDRPQRAAFLFVFPAAIIFVLFIILPLFVALGMGFFSMDNSLTSFEFVGVQNFIDLFKDDRFLNSLKNTLVFAVFEVPLNIVLALAAAMFTSERGPFRKVCRTLMFVPNLFSLTAVGITWRILLDRTIGPVAEVFRRLGWGNISLLNSPDLAMPTLIFVTVWFGFGFNMIIFVSGLQAIPETYYEAARIDGAGYWKQFRYITLPLLTPTLSFVVITHTIRALQVFAQPYVMTDGGPLHRTETVLLYMYGRGFRYSPFDIGYASAITEVLFVIIVVISVVMQRFFAKREVTDV